MLFTTSNARINSAAFEYIISLVKDTSLAIVNLVTEMFRKAQEIAAMNYEFLIVLF